MIKRLYIRPIIEIITIHNETQLLDGSHGWSQDGGYLHGVEQEGDDWGDEYDDDIGGYGNFIDID